MLKDVNSTSTDLRQSKENRFNLSNLDAIEESDVIISFDSQCKLPSLSLSGHLCSNLEQF